MTDQRQAITEYGEAKYAIGYKDGYMAGIVSGILVATCTMIIISITKKNC